MNKLFLIGAIITLTLVGCSEQKKQKVETTKPVEIKKPQQEKLTEEEKEYIKEKVTEFDNLKGQLIKSKKSDGNNIADLNKEIKRMEKFPKWFSKNTQEIRFLKLTKSFIVDLGNAIATRNDKLYDLAIEDYNKLSNELKELLNK
jgi:hypothetical protein